MLTGIVKDPADTSRIREKYNLRKGEPMTNAILSMCDEIDELRYAVRILAYSPEFETRLRIAKGAVVDF